MYGKNGDWDFVAMFFSFMFSNILFNYGKYSNPYTYLSNIYI